MGLGIIGTILVLSILYYIIRDAVEQGVFNALKRYDKLKEKDNNIEKNSF